MRELFTSLMRFTGAVTMFGVEQLQTAIGAPLNSRGAINRLCDTLDSMSDSLASKMDESKKQAYTSMAKAQNDAVTRTLNVIPMDAAGKLMQRTSHSLSGLVSRPNGGAAGAA